MRGKKIKSKTSIIKYLPVLLILLSITIMVGSTFAYFTDRKDTSSDLTFGKVELSAETSTGINGTIRDVIPGSVIVEDTLKFSKAVDSEAIFVRAKLSFSYAKGMTDEEKVLMEPYLKALRNSTDFGINTEVQNGAVWSDKEDNYFYLMTSDKSALKVVDTVDTYVLSESVIIPRSLVALENNAQYMMKIDFNISFEAIQADNMPSNITEIKEMFNLVFPETEEEAIRIKVNRSFTEGLRLNGNNVLGYKGNDSVIVVPQSYEVAYVENYETIIESSESETNNTYISNRFEFPITNQTSFEPFEINTPYGNFEIASLQELTDFITLKNGAETKYPYTMIEKINVSGDGSNNTIKNISDIAFINGANIKEIILPSTIESIGKYAFTNTALELINIPGAVTTISDTAFSGLDDLLYVLCESEQIATTLTTNGVSEDAIYVMQQTMAIGFDELEYSRVEGYQTHIEYAVGDDRYGWIKLIKDDNSVAYFRSVTRQPAQINVLNPDGSVITTITVATGEVTQEPNLSYSDDYFFTGKYYLEPECENEFEFGNTLNESVDIYPEYLEYTDLVYTANGSDAYRVGTHTSTAGNATPENTILPEKIVVRSVYEGKPVTSVGSHAFAGLTQIKNVYLPNSITSISGSSFSGCTALEEITIPENVTSIGDYAFNGCTALEVVNYNSIAASNLNQNNQVFYGAGAEDGFVLNIGSNVTKIPSYLFDEYYRYSSELIYYGPNTLKEINFTEDSQCTSIGQYAFYKCEELVTVNNIPDAITSIGQYAFAGCSSLTSVTLPRDLTTLASYTYQGLTSCTEINFRCKNLTGLYRSNNIFGNCGKDTEGVTVNIANTVDAIPSSMFDTVPKLNNLVYEEGCHFTSIGMEAFLKSGLKEVVIPDYVITVGVSAFQYTETLEKITLGTGLTTLGKNAFSHCTMVNEINFNCINMAGGDYLFEKTGLYGPGIILRVGPKVKAINANTFKYSNTMSGSRTAKITQIIFDENSVCASIGEDAFEGCNRLKEVTFPKSLTSIANCAFNMCFNLYSVTFQSRPSVNRNAFLNCNKILQITYLAGSVSYPTKASIGETRTSASTPFTYSLVTDENGITTYNYKGKVYLVAIENNVTEITADMLDGVNEFYTDSIYSQDILRTLEIPESVTVVTGVEECLSLENISLPSGLTKLEDFRECPKLANIYYNVATLADRTGNSTMYESGTSATGGMKVTFGPDVTYIPANMFNKCTYLKQVTFEESTKDLSIGNYVFKDCSNLQEITIPGRIISVGINPFSGCSKLATINVEENDKYSDKDSNCIYDLTTDTLLCGTYSTTIPDTTKIIGDYAFYGCMSNFTSITIPENVTQIKTYAFAECKNLTQVIINATNLENFTLNNRVFDNAGKSSGGMTVTVGGGVTNIPDYMFYPYNANSEYTNYQCKVVAVNFTESTTGLRIGTYAFKDNTSITSIALPTQVEEIGDNPFTGCIGITSITIPSENALFVSSGCSIYDVVNKKLIFGSTDAIPTDCVEIGVAAFYGNTSITEIVIPDTVTTVGQYAFYNVSSATSLVLGTNLKTISNYAFYGTTALTSMDIKSTSLDALEGRSNNAFTSAGKSGTGIVLRIHANVELLPDYLFASYTSESYAPKISSVTFDEGTVCSYIGNSAFSYVPITTFVMPNTVTSLGENAFSSNSKLTSITLSTQLTAIPNYIFSNCTGLTSVSIPNTITSIGKSAYSNCTALTEVYFNANIGNLTSEDLIFFKIGTKSTGVKFIVGKDVTALPSNLFNGYNSNTYAPKITSIVFEEGSVCTTINSSAFAFTNNTILSVTLPSSITTIASSVFSNCSSAYILCPDSTVAGYASGKGNSNIYVVDSTTDFSAVTFTAVTSGMVNGTYNDGTNYYVRTGEEGSYVYYKKYTA